MEDLLADAYLFTVVNWTSVTGISLGPWPHLTAYMQRVGQRPSVQAAMQAEGHMGKILQLPRGNRKHR